MTLLGSWLRPVTVGEFCAEHLRKTPLARSTAGDLAGLLDWGLLARIFAAGYDDCWLPQRGRLPDEPALRTGRLTLRDAEQGFSNGRTILVRHADRVEPGLARVADDFASLSRALIDVQLYVTPKGQSGFSWHYDLEEVSVVQSAGEKEFFMRENTVARRPLPHCLPRELEFEREVTRAEQRATLVAGDWLYIPSGMWHRAEARRDSFHLSVGVLLPEEKPGGSHAG